MMTERTLIVLGVALLMVGAYVVSVEGPANPFAYWNLVPLITAAVLVVCCPGSSGTRRRFATLGFVSLSTFAVLMAHLSWDFDWGGTATGSSTSGILFVLLPFIGLFCGCIGSLCGWLLAWGVGRE